jgi:hypothetical protein
MIDNWDYRLLGQEYSGQVVYSINEVFYDERGNPIDYVKVPIIMIGTHEQELMQDIQIMLEAFEKDVLWIDDDFPQNKKDKFL